MSTERKKNGCGGIAADLLTAAATNPDEVSGPVREHLSRCPECGEYVDGLARDLRTLSRMAAHYTPGLSRPIRASEKARARVIPFAPRPAFALALAAALVLFFAVPRLFLPGTGRLPGTDLPVHRAAPIVIADDENLFAENALPPVYLEMAGETVTGEEDDFSETLGGDADSELWPDLDPGYETSRADGPKGELPC